LYSFERFLNKKKEILKTKSIIASYQKYLIHISIFLEKSSLKFFHFKWFYDFR